MLRETLHEISSSQNQAWDFPDSDNSKDGVKRKENFSMKAVVEEDEGPSKNRGRSGSEKRSAEIKKGTRVGNDSHIWAERERRKKMRKLFTDLRNFLPQLPVKADSPTIIDHTVIYIKTLQETLQKLETQKKRIEGLKSSSTAPPQMKPEEQPLNNSASIIASSSNSPLGSQHPVTFRTYTSPSVVLNVCGDHAQISVCAPKKPRLSTTVFQVLEKFGINVVSAQIFSADYNRRMYMIQEQASSINGPPRPSAEVSTEVYKQAACDIASCVAS